MGGKGALLNQQVRKIALVLSQEDADEIFNHCAAILTPLLRFCLHGSLSAWKSLNKY
jgi:hypothetical protein